MENAKMNSLIAQYPLVKDLVALKETTWFNPGTTHWLKVYLMLA
ncbi:D-serine dehydratase [Escherichia coli]|uniref:D-serine dehydratase n=1 Tax=Escherichia coli TaxID=562 RepID=A0A376WVB2_ECOLX|nr:D-serine dehydratase [Escherichia coli]